MFAYLSNRLGTAKTLGRTGVDDQAEARLASDAGHEEHVVVIVPVAKVGREQIGAPEIR